MTRAPNRRTTYYIVQDASHGSRYEMMRCALCNLQTKNAPRKPTARHVSFMIVNASQSPVHTATEMIDVCVHPERTVRNPLCTEDTHVMKMTAGAQGPAAPAGAVLGQTAAAGALAISRISMDMARQNPKTHAGTGGVDKTKLDQVTRRSPGVLGLQSDSAPHLGRYLEKT